MHRHRTVAAMLILLAGALPRPAAAQLPEPVVPKGLVRFEGTFTFGGWERRYFEGRDEPFAQDFIRDSLGAGFWPALASADAILQRVTGSPGARLHLGRTTADQVVSTGGLGLGLGYGLTSRLTVFGHVPLVRVRVRASITQDSTEARSGFNPADPVFGDGGFGAAQSATFFAGFDAALQSLQAKLDAGDYDNDPTRRDLAIETLAEGQALRDDLYLLILDPAAASPFLPTGSSAEGTALLSRIGTLQATLGSLGVGGFTQAPALPAARLSDDQFEAFVTQPDGPVAGSLESPTIFRLGDVELGAAYAILDRFGDDVPGRGTGWRVTGRATVRLPTAQLANPSRFFEVGTGDRQAGLDLGLLADGRLGWGGVRAEAGYAMWFGGSQQRRIAPPSEPMPYAATLAAVVRTPGSVLTLGVTPFLRLAPTFALMGGLTYRNRGSDGFELFQGQDSIPGAPPARLAQESAASWTEWTAGLTYRVPPGMRGGRRQMPLEAGVTLRGVLAADGGRVARPLTVRSYLRLFFPFP